MALGERCAVEADCIASRKEIVVACVVDTIGFALVVPGRVDCVPLVVVHLHIVPCVRTLRRSTCVACYIDTGNAVAVAQHLEASCIACAYSEYLAVAVARVKCTVGSLIAAQLIIVICRLIIVCCSVIVFDVLTQIIVNALYDVIAYGAVGNIRVYRAFCCCYRGVDVADIACVRSNCTKELYINDCSCRTAH